MALNMKRVNILVLNIKIEHNATNTITQYSTVENNII